MKKNFIDLFVPGRLCVMGEHSDWAGCYRKTNNKIEKGYAIVTGIEEGIYARAYKCDDFEIFNETNNYKFESKMNIEILKKIAIKGGYWSYVAGVAACIKEKYNIGGVKIVITKATLPEKKGLSSSAAICVLIARAFNQLYKLNLTIADEMNLAYLGEISTPSCCGRLDQACAYGKKPILMIFDGDKIEVKNINVKNRLHFVFADLNAKKNTIKILKDLNNSYPFAINKFDKNVHKGLGITNKKIVLSSVECIEKGNIKRLGFFMNKAQENFDKNIATASKDELKAPILHSIFKDKYIKSLSYGAKGVGSQGDGSVQILAKNCKSQKLIKDYFKNKLKMNAYELTIEPTCLIKKAIIPVAGDGTRMYPITKCIKKSFLPVIDSDGIIKPVILKLIEEVVDAGIEEVCLIIDKKDKRTFDNFFKKKLPKEMTKKLSPELLEYEYLIEKIGKKINYVYQKEKLGLGHAVSLCEKFANNEPVLLVLGDQLYESYINESCTKQFLNNYSKTNKLSITACEIDLKNVSKYGILCGTKKINSDYFDIKKIIEKPNVDIAEKKYYTKVKNEKKYYAVFGEYILTDDVFKLLKRNIKENRKENGEFQLTPILDEIRKEKGMIAFIPKGKMFDVGNVEAYKNTFIEKIKLK